MNRVLVILLFVTACSSTNEVTTPAGIGSAEPFLFTDEAGQVYLSWIEKTDSISNLKYSKWTDTKWSEPVLVASGKNWFVNWADYPMLAVNKDNFVAHFLEKSGDDTFAYDVKLSTSTDGNKWSTPFVIHDDGKQAEHGFVSLLPYEDNFLVAWLDGRNTVMEGMENMDHHDGHHGEMTLRAAIINSAGNKISEWELDPRTCDCCQTTTALTSNGPVVIYRDRSEEEIRDIFITRFVHNEWTKPQAVYADNWKIAGCPVNGPRADARGNNLVVAWFTAAKNEPAVRLIFSQDGGESFGRPLRVDAGSPIGRVDVALISDDVALVSWMEDASLKVVRIDKDGIMGDVKTIATSSEARSSGFPQMTRAGDKLVFAWTDDVQKTVLTTIIDSHAF
ncbi:MAG: exo-alpha-sialidase [Cyclobacteriaceae bacterium]|nr:exo-alpha-sialidase [Cyclobacteriaceae bacterium]